jgi:hypothetical protein
MKTRALVLALALGVCGVIAQPGVAQQPQSTYEMEMYHVVIAHHGPNWKPQSDEAGMDVRMEVLANVRKAAAEGLIAVAGLVNDETDVEFILILRCETKTEALQLMNSAKNVRNGFFEPEIYSWFAPKGLTVAAPRSLHGETGTGSGK